METRAHTVTSPTTQLALGQQVWLTSEHKAEAVVSGTGPPRKYTMNTDGGLAEVQPNTLRSTESSSC